MNKKRRNVSPKYGTMGLIYLIFFLLFALSYIVISLNLIASLDGQLKQTILLITLGPLFLMLFLSIHNLFKWRSYYTNVRFDYTDSKIARNVRTEKLFLRLVNKEMKRKEKQESAIVVFSVIKFKKIVFARYGYDRGAAILGSVYQALGHLESKNRKIIYGYDYNENFLLFIPFTQKKEIEQYIEQLSNKMSDLLQDQELQLKFNSDFGVSYNINEDGEHMRAEQMLQRALIAADFGRTETELGGIRVYEERMFEKNKRNVQLGREVEQGLEQDQFVLYFQPKFDLRLKRFAGSEALVRWNHPELGVLSPAAFILFAEQSDLIMKIDRYVVEKTCQAVARWSQKGERLMPVSINISKRSLFMANIYEHVVEMTKKYNVNPMLLEIEIVESPALQDVLLLLSLVKKFKRLGVKVAIDDFGTGYSSLSYIKKIPFDIIKIDKAFLDDLNIDQKSRAIVQNIIELAHILEAYVVIEGVQDEKQVKMLTQMGADAIQGFYYSRPLPEREFIALLNDNDFESEGRRAK
ncbi:MAG TPA: EAL domain-containing protein [Bacilli bacterium]|nr:EAL domain-containing protein [Bacilli bacterium]